MEKTSLGFHTIMLYLKLTKKEARNLFYDFRDYANNTDEIKIFPLNNSKEANLSKDINNWLRISGQQYYIVNYKKQDKGIRWLWRYGTTSPGFINLNEVEKSCSIKATINPKILLGENDYLTASTADCLPEVERLFNIEAKKISPILREFNKYVISRPDYCVNFDLKELGIPCTSEQMITLIRRGDIPHHYEERTEYSETSKRYKSDKNSFYLVSNSVTINCYRKQSQLEKNFPNCVDIESAKDIIRFEVQCNYLKTYELKRDIKNKSYNPNLSNSQVMCELLPDVFCASIINNYFQKVIKNGDYFTLERATKMVKSQGFEYPKEQRLINALNEVNKCRGIHKAKATFVGTDLTKFKQSIRDLSSLNINPVTIPREWNIPYIKNLIRAYYNQMSIKMNKLNTYIDYNYKDDEYIEEKDKEYFEKYLEDVELGTVRFE